jgi:hypothetical protein
MDKPKPSDKAKEVAKKMAEKSKSQGAKGMNAYLNKIGATSPASRKAEKAKVTKNIQYGG